MMPYGQSCCVAGQVPDLASMVQRKQEDRIQKGCKDEWQEPLNGVAAPVECSGTGQQMKLPDGNFTAGDSQTWPAFSDKQQKGGAARSSCLYRSAYRTSTISVKVQYDTNAFTFVDISARVSSAIQAVLGSALQQEQAAHVNAVVVQGCVQGLLRLRWPGHATRHRHTTAVAEHATPEEPASPTISRDSVCVGPSGPVREAVADFTHPFSSSLPSPAPASSWGQTSSSASWVGACSGPAQQGNIQHAVSFGNGMTSVQSLRHGPQLAMAGPVTEGTEKDVNTSSSGSCAVDTTTHAAIPVPLPLPIDDEPSSAPDVTPLIGTVMVPEGQGEGNSGGGGSAETATFSFMPAQDWPHPSAVTGDAELRFPAGGPFVSHICSEIEQRVSRIHGVREVVVRPSIMGAALDDDMAPTSPTALLSGSSIDLSPSRPPFSSPALPWADTTSSEGTGVWSQDQDQGQQLGSGAIMLLPPVYPAPEPPPAPPTLAYVQPACLTAGTGPSLLVVYLNLPSRRSTGSGGASGGSWQVMTRAVLVLHQQLLVDATFSLEELEERSWLGPGGQRVSYLHVEVPPVLQPAELNLYLLFEPPTQKTALGAAGSAAATPGGAAPVAALMRRLKGGRVVTLSVLALPLPAATEVAALLERMADTYIAQGGGAAARAAGLPPTRHAALSTVFRRNFADFCADYAMVFRLSTAKGLAPFLNQQGMQASLSHWRAAAGTLPVTSGAIGAGRGMLHDRSRILMALSHIGGLPHVPEALPSPPAALPPPPMTTAPAQWMDTQAHHGAAPSPPQPALADATAAVRARLLALQEALRQGGPDGPSAGIQGVLAAAGVPPSSLAALARLLASLPPAPPAIAGGSPSPGSLPPPGSIVGATLPSLGRGGDLARGTGPGPVTEAVDGGRRAAKRLMGGGWTGSLVSWCDLNSGGPAQGKRSTLGLCRMHSQRLLVTS